MPHRLPCNKIKARSAERGARRRAGRPARLPCVQSNARGFTLIEVLAALLIFSVAIVGIIEGVGSALSYQADLSMRQRAAMLASNVLEEVKYTGDLSEGEDQGQFEGDDAVFTWKSAIEEGDIPGLMKVTATVAWGPQENSKEYVITAMMYDQTSLEDQGQGTEDTSSGQGGQGGMGGQNDMSGMGGGGGGR